MHKPRITVLAAGLLIVSTIISSFSFAQDQALIEASRNGDLKQVQELLDKGADVNAMDRHGRTSLDVAVRKSHVAVVKVLIDRDARHSWDIYRTLFWVINGGKFEIARLLLEGADVNGKLRPEIEPPLLFAARNGEVELGRLLLETGADANARMDDDLTLLMWVAITGDLGAVKVLLELGADANAKTPNGWTAKQLADHKGHKEIVELLIAHGAKK